MNAPVNHTALANVQNADLQVNEAPGFGSLNGWKLANRIGEAFAASSIVPAIYQNNVANCIVALEMANRMGASPLQVMQNLYIVHGNPGWSSKFLVACFNQCGRFTSIRYEWNEDRTSCRAWAIEKANNIRIDGPTVTLAMAQAEGWSSKNGSKWKTMPELMLMYRAAAFLIRTYAPEISMGMQTDDEIIDVTPTNSDGSMYVPGKPEVTMPTAKAATIVDQDTGELHTSGAPVINPADNPEVGAEASKEEAKPEVAPAKPKRAVPADGAPSMLATEGERKLILNRVKNNGLNLIKLIEDAGLTGAEFDMATLAGLTKDGFIALKDQLPAAA